MAKVWLPKLWATIPSIWTCGRPNSDKGARRYGRRNPYCAVSPKSDRLSSEAVLGILSSFLRKPVHTKVGDNFVAHNLDTEFALFGVRTWDIWCQQRKGCESGKSGRGWFYGNQVAFSPKEDLTEGKVENAPRLPKGINTTSWVPKEGWSIHPIIRELTTRRKSTGRKPTATASPRVA
jgi:hypothetical protein